jgi:NADH-quinone oxidoreductase subunit K
MGIELILNSANLNLIAFNRFGGLSALLPGHVFALFVIIMAAAEAAVALAIIINLYKSFHTVNVDEAHEMRG